MSDDGADIPTAQELLSYAEVSTTMIYKYVMRRERLAWSDRWIGSNYLTKGLWYFCDEFASLGCLLTTRYVSTRDPETLRAQSDLPRQNHGVRLARRRFDFELETNEVVARHFEKPWKQAGKTKKRRGVSPSVMRELVGQASSINLFQLPRTEPSSNSHLRHVLAEPVAKE